MNKRFLELFGATIIGIGIGVKACLYANWFSQDYTSVWWKYAAAFLIMFIGFLIFITSKDKEVES
jgi:hypothetical protein